MDAESCLSFMNSMIFCETPPKSHPLVSPYAARRIRISKRPTRLHLPAKLMSCSQLRLRYAVEERKYESGSGPVG